MFRRVAEVMTFLNLLPLRDQFTAALSGGEKQKLVLGSVIAMHPRILVLDEPTSQLDPVAATDIFNLVESLNRGDGLYRNFNRSSAWRDVFTWPTAWL